MGYRGEDVPPARGDWGRQQPWQQSSATPANAGAWDDGSRGYGGDSDYPAVDGGGYGYGLDGGYPGQEQQGHGPLDGQYGDPYAQQRSGGYGPGQGQGGYGGPQGYSRDDYRYEQPQGYEQHGYGTSDGYQSPGAGYGQSGGYPARPADGYPAPNPGSGGYPAVPPGSGGYPGADAGNDWYSGQPAAANGASFADTGTYALNGRVADEYRTGPRHARRDPVRGYPPSPGHGDTSPLPAPARLALPAPPDLTGAGSPPVAETRQQARYDESVTVPGRAQNGGFQGAAGRDTFANGAGYDDYSGDPGFGRNDAPYQDSFDGRGRRPIRHGRKPEARSAWGLLSGKRLLFSAVGVVVVAVIGVVAYTFLFKPGSPSSDAAATGPLPTGSAQATQQACAKELGTYCHIEFATGDPKPLTVAELYPTTFTNEMDKISYQLVSTKLDKTCSNAVIGQTLINALQAGKCTQVVRASYVSGNGQIMGTIGVVNLGTTNEAHDAGKVVGQNDFIAPLISKTGVASKLGNGTGVVEAEFKGHYLILTWSEYVNGTVPSTKAQDRQLEQFSSDLVSGTANIALTQRMVTGSPGAAV